MSALDPIKARLAAATPGPWTSDSDGWVESDHSGQYVVSADAAADRESDPDLVTMPDADRALIENAPTDLAKLVAALEAAIAVVDEVIEVYAEEPGLIHTDVALADLRKIKAQITEALK